MPMVDEPLLTLIVHETRSTVCPISLKLGVLISKEVSKGGHEGLGRGIFRFFPVAIIFS